MYGLQYLLAKCVSSCYIMYLSLCCRHFIYTCTWCVCVVGGGGGGRDGGGVEGWLDVYVCVAI